MTDQEKFAKQAQAAINSMKAAFKKLEKLGNASQTLCDERREFEEENDLCGCVSEAFEDMVRMTDVASHVLETYGNMLVHAAEKALNHDAEMEAVAQAKAQAEQIIGGMLNRQMEQQAVETDVSKLN